MSFLSSSRLLALPLFLSISIAAASATMTAVVKSCSSCLNHHAELKSFLKDGEAEFYHGVEVRFIQEFDSEITFFEDGKEKERAKLYNLNDKTEMHRMMTDRGFVMKGDEEIKKVKAQFLQFKKEEEQYLADIAAMAGDVQSAKTREGDHSGEKYEQNDVKAKWQEVTALRQQINQFIETVHPTKKEEALAEKKRWTQYFNGKLPAMGKKWEDLSYTERYNHLDNMLNDMKDMKKNIEIISDLNIKAIEQNDVKAKWQEVRAMTQQISQFIETVHPTKKEEVLAEKERRMQSFDEKLPAMGKKWEDLSDTEKYNHLDNMLNDMKDMKKKIETMAD